MENTNYIQKVNSMNDTLNGDVFVLRDGRIGVMCEDTHLLMNDGEEIHTGWYGECEEEHFEPFSWSSKDEDIMMICRIKDGSIETLFELGKPIEYDFDIYDLDSSYVIECNDGSRLMYVAGTLMNASEVYPLTLDSLDILENIPESDKYIEKIYKLATPSLVALHRDIEKIKTKTYLDLLFEDEYLMLYWSRETYLDHYFAKYKNTEEAFYSEEASKLTEKEKVKYLGKSN